MGLLNGDSIGRYLGNDYDYYSLFIIDSMSCICYLLLNCLCEMVDV